MWGHWSALAILSSTNIHGVTKVGCLEGRESSETLHENDFVTCRPSLNCLEQTDPELLEFLRQDLLWPPFLVEHNKSHFEAYKPEYSGRKGR